MSWVVTQSGYSLSGYSKRRELPQTRKKTGKKKRNWAMRQQDTIRHEH